MNLFKCQACGQLLYFENSKCEQCGRRLGYEPESFRLIALEWAENEKSFRDARGERAYRFCANESYGVCNWLVPAESAGEFCLCCRHNRTIPDVSAPENLARWNKIETAKHGLFYGLTRLRLPLDAPVEGAEMPLMFDFLAETDPARKVVTGHVNGLITIALAEADDAEREQRRVDLHEPYRTLLGHFRHEVGHYYWERLVRDQPQQLKAFRALFGDETADYARALQDYYDKGPPADWQDRHVSAYATSHPWEDFAETWAHYLHIVDTLEIAGAFNMSVHPRLMRVDALDANVDFNVYGASTTIEQIMETWLPLSLALNSLNRAMGQADLYPFILLPKAIEKLAYIHKLTHGTSRTE